MSEFLPPVMAVLEANISGFSAKMAEARGELDATAKHGLSSLASFGAATAAALATTAVAVGGFAIHMADQYEAAHARLQNAIANTGGKMNAFQADVDMLDKRFAKLGFDQTQVEDALGKLTTATQNPIKAMQLMQLAADMARQRNISLADSADLLDRVLAGKAGRSLSAFGIDLQAVKGKGTDVNAVLDILRQRTEGAATAFGNTFAGKLQGAEARLKDLAITLGQKLVPALSAVLDWVSKAVDWFKKHEQVAKDVAIAIGIVVAALTVLDIALKVIEADPIVRAITLIIVALVTLITWLKELAGSWKQLWNDMEHVFGDVAGWILSGLRMLLDGFLSYVQGNLRGMVDAFGWVPWVGGKLKTALNKVREFHTAADRDMTQWSHDMFALGQSGGDNILNGLKPGLNAAGQAIAAFAQSLQPGATALAAAGPIGAPMLAAIQGVQQLAVNAANAVGSTPGSGTDQTPNLGGTASFDNLPGPGGGKGLANKISTAMQAAIDAIKQKVADFKQAMTSFHDAIKGGFDKANDIVSALGSNQGTQAVDVKQFFAEQIRKALLFSGVLQRLQKAGLNQALLQRLAAAGPDAYPLASALEQSGVKYVNAQQSRLDYISNTTANTMTGVAFGAAERQLEQQIININISAGSIWDKNALIREIREALIGYGRKNPTIFTKGRVAA
ncbi:MAG: phage tail tape measure protein [Actinomycetota bacterium]